MLIDGDDELKAATGDAAFAKTASDRTNAFAFILLGLAIQLVSACATFQDRDAYHIVSGYSTCQEVLSYEAPTIPAVEKTRAALEDWLTSEPIASNDFFVQDVPMDRAIDPFEISILLRSWKIMNSRKVISQIDETEGLSPSVFDVTRLTELFVRSQIFYAGVLEYKIAACEIAEENADLISTEALNSIVSTRWYSRADLRTCALSLDDPYALGMVFSSEPDLGWKTCEPAFASLQSREYRGGMTEDESRSDKLRTDK